ncbi:MAG TPA: oxidoreductase, partial [Micrococcaceae bacterium]|nr:oxidoreductase [Micrococcaceae bacterium]
MSSKPGRLGVGIIGAGKVGAVLGAALRAAGHAVVGVSAV